METYLYFHEVDDTLFPELERAPGVYAIEAALLKPGADRRIPVPETSAAALLVSYTLLAAEVPAGSVWQMEVAGTNPDGKQRKAVWALLAPPPKGDNVRRVERPLPAKLPEGTVYRAVFWVDLSSPLREKMLQPGDTLTLRYGRAAASIALTPPGQRPAR